MALQDTYITANGSRGHHKFTLYISEHSTSVSTNQSYVGFTLQLSPIQTGWNWDITNGITYSININGTSYTGSLAYYDGKSTVTIRSGTQYITHNSDGNKTMSFSFSITSLNQSYLPGTASKSGTLALTSIARKATISTAPDFTDIQNPTITYANPAGNAVDALEACISWTGAADIAYRAINKTGTLSYTFNFTDAERRKLWSAVTSGYTKAVKFYVRTTLGGEYHYSTLDKTLTLVDASPTIAPTVIDEGEVSTSLTGNTERMIKYYNMMRYEANATARKGATIMNAGCWNSNINYAGVAGYIGYTGDNTFKFWVEDSRGNRVEKTITKTMVDYINLTVNAKVSKPTVDGDIDIEVYGNYWSGDFGAMYNTLDVQMRRKDGDAEWGEWGNFSVIPYPVDNKYSGSKTYRGLDYTQTYTFQFRAYDKVHQLAYGNELYTLEIPVRALPVFEWGENDFNFNVPIKYLDIPQDFIVEEGSSGIWKYRKWYSGKAEAWGKYTLTTTMKATWGSMYIGDTQTGRIQYPFQFAEKPVEIVNLNAGNYAAWLYSMNGGAGNNNEYSSGSYGVIRPASAGNDAHTFYINFYEVGRWK